MTFALVCAAFYRHPLSIGCSALLAALSASLLGMSVPLVLLAWMAASLVALEAWLALEPFALRRLGCRVPNRLECERLDAAPSGLRRGGPVVPARTSQPGHQSRAVRLARGSSARGHAFAGKR